MKYLIIGGTGLISTSITRFLLEQGEDVTLYNRGQREARFPGGAKQITGDRKQLAAFEAQMAEAGLFDCVIDMICYSPEEAESDVRAFKGRAGHFIFCSTVDVYNKPADRLPYAEQEGRRGITDYGRNKVKCEDIFMEAHARGDFPVTTIRPAATYGEGGTIIHTFGWATTYLDRIRKGKPVVVHGDGSSLWVMCHIDDVARAFLNAAGSPAAFGKAYHTTGEEWLTWNGYHRCVAQALNAPEPKLVHIPTDLLDRVAPRRAGITTYNFQYNNIYDNSAAKRDLGFQYTIPWVEGARRTYTWLEQRGRIANSDDDPLDDRLIAAWERLGSGLVKELDAIDA
jgi:nucleoside-diphosphate-sugar epimerase